jgi:hypothetical protein
MASFSSNNGVATFLPSKAFTGQIYVDQNGDKWVFNGLEQVWELSGPIAVTQLVSDKISGIISAEDKQFLDSIPEKPGGFSIVVQPQAVLVTPTNPEGTINGRIMLVSDSLNISCLIGENQSPAYCKPGTLQILQCENIQNFQAISVKLTEQFLRTLIIKPPIATGAKGATGLIGPRGAPGFSEGPAGIIGVAGQNTLTSCTLNKIEYNDLDSITERGVVDLAILDTGGYGCKMVLTDAPITAPSVIAEQLRPATIGRSIAYPEITGDLCKASRLKDYAFLAPPGDTVGEVYLTRVPETGAKLNKVELNNTYSLRTFVQDLVQYYITELKKVDADYGKTVKAYIGAVDSKARSNLATLSEQLTQCQFNLPSIEYAISFVNCNAPPEQLRLTPSPANTTTTYMPTGPGPKPGTGPGPGSNPNDPGGPGGEPGIGIVTTSSPAYGFLLENQLNYGGNVGSFQSNNNTFNIRF